MEIIMDTGVLKLQTDLTSVKYDSCTYKIITTGQLDILRDTPVRLIVDPLSWEICKHVIIFRKTVEFILVYMVVKNDSYVLTYSNGTIFVKIYQNEELSIEYFARYYGGHIESFEELHCNLQFDGILPVIDLDKYGKIQLLRSRQTIWTTDVVQYFEVDYDKITYVGFAKHIEFPNTKETYLHILAKKPFHIIDPDTLYIGKTQYI